MKRLGILLPVLLAFQVGVQPALAWTWPVDGPVLRPFVLGDDPYAGGQHRGIDIGAPAGTSGARAGGRNGELRGHRPGERQDRHDPRRRTATSVTLVHLGSIGVRAAATVAEGDLVGTSARAASRDRRAARPSRRSRTSDARTATSTRSGSACSGCRAPVDSRARPSPLPVPAPAHGGPPSPHLVCRVPQPAPGRNRAAARAAQRTAPSAGPAHRPARPLVRTPTSLRRSAKAGGSLAAAPCAAPSSGVQRHCASGAAVAAPASAWRTRTAGTRRSLRRSGARCSPGRCCACSSRAAASSSCARRAPSTQARQTARPRCSSSGFVAPQKTQTRLRLRAGGSCRP